MPGIEKFEAQRGFLTRVEPFALHAPALAQRHGQAAFDGRIGLPVGEERVGGDALLLANAQHDVHRVVQHHIADLPCGFCGEKRSARMAAHQHRERADVILMGVREQNGVHAVIG